MYIEELLRCLFCQSDSSGVQIEPSVFLYYIGGQAVILLQIVPPKPPCPGEALARPVSSLTCLSAAGVV